MRRESGRGRGCLGIDVRFGGNFFVGGGVFGYGEGTGEPLIAGPI